jgi:hypothetical protein
MSWEVRSEILLCELKALYRACYSVRLHTWKLIQMSWELSSEILFFELKAFCVACFSERLNSWELQQRAEKWALKFYWLISRLYLEPVIHCTWIHGKYCGWDEKWAVKFHSVNWRIYWERWFSSTEFEETSAGELNSKQWSFILRIETFIGSVWFSENEFVKLKQMSLIIEHWNFIEWIVGFIWSVCFSETEFVVLMQMKSDVISNITFCDLKALFGSCDSVWLTS